MTEERNSSLYSLQHNSTFQNHGFFTPYTKAPQVKTLRFQCLLNLIIIAVKNQNIIVSFGLPVLHPAAAVSNRCVWVLSAVMLNIASNLILAVDVYLPVFVLRFL